MNINHKGIKDLSSSFGTGEEDKIIVDPSYTNGKWRNTGFFQIAH